MKITHTASREERLAARMDLLVKDKAALLHGGLVYVAANDADGQGVRVSPQHDGKVFHTYPAYGVGADVMLSTYRFLDLTPLGRRRYTNAWPWHDTYGAPDRHEHHH